MNLKIWAASLQSQKKFPTHTSVEHAVAELRAFNKDEAEDAAMKAALNNWPLEDGWSQHSVVVCLIDVPERNDES